ncbi:uncharacterized protein LOC126996334 [Eriocheir sinensis]|uniref:uncharacterized protein LOC126996334 n=1 Tax=Eriocheir sinensis TaxID=95602 RepID=UPI0021C5C254|nr:uncharacterized protein LOC126996334 [Eriocheir sinensis]
MLTHPRSISAVTARGKETQDGNMGLSPQMFKKCEDSTENCATKETLMGGKREDVEASDTKETLDGGLGNIKYLRPVLSSLRGSGIITWLEQDIFKPTHSSRCHLLLLAGAIRFFHVLVVLMSTVYVFLQNAPHDVGEMTMVASQVGTNIVSVSMLLVLLFRNSVLARLCYRLTTLDSFFHAWQREKPVPEAIKIRRPALLSKDPTVVLMLLLFLLGISVHFSALLKLPFPKLMIALPIFCVMAMATGTIFLVLLLYRVVIKLLAFEMRRFMTAALTEGTALSLASNRNSGIYNCLGVARGSSLSLSTDESPDITHAGAQNEEQGQPLPAEVDILGEAFLHVGQIKDDLLAYLGVPLCLTMVTFSTFVICFIYESLTREFSLGSLCFTALGVVSPMLTVFAICRSPETLRAQTEQSDLILRTAQLRVPCLPLQMQVDELCINPCPWHLGARLHTLVIIFR